MRLGRIHARRYTFEDALVSIDIDFRDPTVEEVEAFRIARGPILEKVRETADGASLEALGEEHRKLKAKHAAALVEKIETHDDYLDEFSLVDLLEKMQRYSEGRRVLVKIADEVLDDGRRLEAVGKSEAASA